MGNLFKVMLIKNKKNKFKLRILRLITSKKLLKQKKIFHGFFNRNGGKSNGIYKSLNCGIGSKDNRNKVKKNLKIVKNKIK